MNKENKLYGLLGLWCFLCFTLMVIQVMAWCPAAEEETKKFFKNPPPPPKPGDQMKPNPAPEQKPEPPLPQAPEPTPPAIPAPPPQKVKPAPIPAPTVKPPPPPLRPPAGTGIEPLVFNPLSTVPMWENWWSRNRLYYLPFKNIIQWADDINPKKMDDGTLNVEANPISKQSLEFLIKCLKENENPIIRANAALALGKYKHRGAVPALKDALKNDANFDVKNVSALALGIMGEESAITDLKAILFNETDEKSQMISRAYAALALGYIKTEESINILKEALDPNKKLHKEIQCSSILSLGNIQNKSSVDFLGKILNDASYDEYVRSYAAVALGRLKDESALPYLIKSLQVKESTIRSSIALAMGLIKSPKAKDELINLISKDKSTETKAFAVISLAQLGDNKAFDTIHNLTKKPDFNIEGMAFLSLGLLGNKASIPELQKIVVKKTKPLSRGAAIIALGMMKDISSVNTLIEVVQKEINSDPVSWNYAVLALGMIGDQQAVPALEEAFKNAQQRVDMAKVGYNNLTISLAMLGKRNEVLEELYKRISDSKSLPQIKTRALHGIGYIGDKASIKQLMDFYVAEKNDDLRSYAILAMGFILDNERVNPLYKITADNNFVITMLILNHIFFSKPE
ncbi:MAG: HEAT repeat domain-containing protein [Planctomycetes bacterium]|nr:HEAT repeat domain-containing protein [Planctomycetota bacterium]